MSLAILLKRMRLHKTIFRDSLPSQNPTKNTSAVVATRAAIETLLAKRRFLPSYSCVFSAASLETVGKRADSPK